MSTSSRTQAHLPPHATPGCPGSRSHITMMGCRIDNLTMEETLQTVEGFIASGRPHQHVVVNVDKLVKAQADPELRRIINDCDLVNVDGMPVVWASRWLGQPLKERVAGVDLFEALMARAADKGWRVFLLGAREEVVAAVRAAYETRFPHLVFAGHRNGYWSDEEEPEVGGASHRRGPRRPAVRRHQLAEEGALPRCASGDHARALRDGRGRHLRRGGRPRAPGAGLDAEGRPGVVLPLPAGAAPHVQALLRRGHGLLRHAVARMAGHAPPGAALKISITLDYEIFFGRNLDGVQRTLVEPAQALADVAQRQGVPLVFFVDATWLLRLRGEARRHPALQTDHDLVIGLFPQGPSSRHRLCRAANNHC
jgi:hypothetical protein